MIRIERYSAQAAGDEFIVNNYRAPASFIQKTSPDTSTLHEKSNQATGNFRQPNANTPTQSSQHTMREELCCSDPPPSNIVSAESVGLFCENGPNTAVTAAPDGLLEQKIFPGIVHERVQRGNVFGREANDYKES
ncbi:hypothetical protein BJX61DRAFT_56436 [Aspergillus egyptiacus]|nr:hypothetical protein BJX61DRAFT_56436 [Aspergillus egyptiacus]